LTSLAAVEKVKGILLPIVEPGLVGLSVPDVSGSTSVAGLTVHYTISNIQIEQINFGRSPVLLIPPNEVGLGLPDTTCTVSMDWSYKAIGIHDSGSATDVLGMDINLVAFLFDQNGGMGAKAKSATVDINKIKITVHGGSAWFYQLVVDVFKGTIKNTIERALASELKVVISSLSSYYLNTSPTIPLTPDILIDYGLTQDPVITSQNSLTDSRGNFLSKKIKHFQCPYPPTPLPETQSKFPITSYISETMGSCLGYLLFKTSSMSYEITEKMLPKNSPVHLNTSDANLKNLIPNLYKTFPNVPIVLECYAVGPPTVEISKATQTLAVIFPAIVNVTVPYNYSGLIETVEAFAFNLVLTVEAKVAVASTPITTISGKIISIAHNESLQSTRIGDVNMKNIDNLVQFFVAAGVEPQLNKLIQKGLPLPQTKGVQLVKPTVIYGDGYLGFDTDFSYNPKGARTVMMERMAERLKAPLV